VKFAVVWRARFSRGPAAAEYYPGRPRIADSISGYNQKEAVRLQLKFEKAIADSETAPALLPALAESLDRNFHKLVLRTFGMNPMIEIGEAVGLILRLINICC
jgi:hypothetical protein